jgi:hypothetical protein
MLKGSYYFCLFLNILFIPEEFQLIPALCYAVSTLELFFIMHFNILVIQLHLRFPLNLKFLSRGRFSSMTFVIILSKYSKPYVETFIGIGLNF